MDRVLNPPWLVRVGLVAFVLFWLFGPGEFRSAVPIWFVFLVALGVELQFFMGGLRASPDPDEPPDRGPQPVDRERYGYPDEEDEELWDTDFDEIDDEDFAVPRRRRPLGSLLVGLGTVLVLAVFIWFVESRRGWDSLDGETRARAAARFSAEASVIAQKRVTVQCDESGSQVGIVQHADGAAVVGGTVAYLTPERCLQLYRLAFEHDEPSSQTARAIVVLAHEAWHLRGIEDEGVTECFAVQSGVALGRRFGLSESTAGRLMRQQLVENALRRGGGFEYRMPADCRDGRHLDLNSDVERFP